jgi:tyrosine-protein kinase Etk/Wzc
MNRTVSLAPLWSRVWMRRKPILTLVFVATVITGVAAFLLPTWYKADAELLPPGEEETGLGLATILRGMALPGIKLPTQVTPGDVFMVVLQSRRINDQIVQRFDLMKRYKTKFMIDTVKELLRHAKFRLTQAGTIQISVEDRDPQRAADIANSYIEFLDRFTRESRMSKGRRTRIFVEERLNETKQELARAEQTLTEYQAHHKAIALTPGMSSAVEEGARLYAQRMALQVRLGVVENYSTGGDEETQLRQQLAALDHQLQQLPETGLELARLVRDVKALEQVFELLTAQYEDARISEARDVVSVETLDPATKPEKKSRPHRILMMAGAFLLSSVLGMGLAVIQPEPKPMPVMRAVGSE